ncbi:MAG: SufS family cysteine desulfurase [Ndongobacter sp.]|nr:SufS family cysteine desulfurase [Ndongobacter sp.]
MISVLEKMTNPGFDVEKIRGDFDYLKLDGEPIVYLDNAATTQRPNAVIDRVAEFYRSENANPLRGNHRLSLAATEAYESARARIAEFIRAPRPEQVIFTRNASESLNLVAYSLGLSRLRAGDEVLITRMEHHSNSVNWQFVCQKTGAKLVYLDLEADYQISIEQVKAKLNERTKIFAFTGASNVLSTVPDAREFIRLGHEAGAVCVMDGAQLVPHERVDVQDLDCDFLAFSGHKMLAPFGVGVLYGKQALLEEMPPFLYGGEMIEYVYDDYATYAPLPYKFEAGTQNVGGAVGLHAAIDYIEAIGIDKIEAYEKALGEYCAQQLRALGFIDVYHPEHGARGAAVAFNVREVHPHDVSTILDARGIAIRSGHHCTQQLHAALELHASCRASFAFYNTKEEVDQLIDGLREVRKIMGFEA